MPTIAGLRRRGYTPAAIRHFCEAIGITKSEGTVEMGVLENAIRGDLDASAPRRMAVLDPLKVVITNFPEDQVETVEAGNHPKDESMGKRKLQLTREVYIDRADFREQANKKYKRLVLDGEVRLRNAYVIRCDEAIRDANDDIVELRCTYDPDTLGKNPEGRKVRGVIHWVSATLGRPAEVRVYDRLFRSPEPGRGHDFLDDLNPDSLRVLTGCVVESALAEASVDERFQFEREGYFCLDPVDASAEKLVFNRIVSLRDSWAKMDTP
jgi:glutaminyl-tRNA synthetase